MNTFLGQTNLTVERREQDGANDYPIKTTNRSI